LAFCGGSGPSDYIETRKGIYGKEGSFMSTFEEMQIMLIILMIIVPLIVELVKAQKK
jgi:hypothetical protein